IREPGQTPKDLVPSREVLIQTHVPLVLVIVLGRRAREVVRGRRRRRQGIALQERERNRIHLTGRNDVAGKWRTGRSYGARWVVNRRHGPGNRLREDALTLQHRGHG